MNRFLSFDWYHVIEFGLIMSLTTENTHPIIEIISPITFNGNDGETVLRAIY